MKALTALLALLTAALPAEDGRTFRSPSPDLQLSFPRDHGSHPDYRTEWWYFTGNLEGESGTPYGYQLTFFRNRLEPPGGALEGSSSLAASELFAGHFGISHGGEKRHASAERLGRPGLGQAFASTETLDVSMGAWRAVLLPDGAIELVADGEFGAANLVLRPSKPPVLHGEGGYHRKAGTSAQASHYISFTRMETTGTLRWGDRTESVRGTSWMDHEFFSEVLGGEEIGWDWFALQLDDGTDLMLYRLLRKDRSYNPSSSGTIVAADGASRSIPSGEFTVAARGNWRSDVTGGEYPMGWSISLPGEGLELTVTALFESQEMLKLRTTGSAYWEGAVRVLGTRHGQPVGGVGYVELVGYARPFALPGVLSATAAPVSAESP